MKKGTVFNIQKFCVHDGPGIRTTVFLKGCPLSCLWCHNPESNSKECEIFYDSKKCILCSACIVCEKKCHDFDESGHMYNRNECLKCGLCAEKCPASALEKVGEQKTVEEVIETVLRDKAFYETSGGGMTISGGEPMMQFDFSLELMKQAKKNGLHTCMETCGFAKSEHFEEIAEYTDIFLFDYKETDEKKHKEYTGVSNELILKNLRMLDAHKSKIILRCPIIPTLNDTHEHFEGIARVANSLSNIIEVNIEPYHPLGSSKSEMLGKTYALPILSFPEDKDVDGWIEKISAKTSVKVVKN